MLLVSWMRTILGDRAFGAAGPQVCNYLPTDIIIVLSTIGDRAFPVSAAQLWNTATDVTSSSSISIFRKHLKTHLFRHSIPESPLAPVQ